MKITDSYMRTYLFYICSYPEFYQFSSHNLMLSCLKKMEQNAKPNVYTKGKLFFPLWLFQIKWHKKAISHYI